MLVLEPVLLLQPLPENQPKEEIPILVALGGSHCVFENPTVGVAPRGRKTHKHKDVLQKRRPPRASPCKEKFPSQGEALGASVF